MTTLKDFQRWERVQEKADELRYPIVSHLRKVWEEHYCKLGNHRLGDRFPDDVESISIWDDKVSISGTSSCRGCTDHESCSMPVEFAFGDEESRAELVRKKEETEKLVKARAERDKEDAERFEYMRLKEKFEGL